MTGRAGPFAAAFVCSLALLSGCGAADNTPPELVVHTTLGPPNQDIYLIDGPEAEPRRVTDDPALDYNATFSPDGRWLVFTSERSGGPDLYALDLAEGGEPVRLTHSSALDDAADISSDGEQIVFVSTRDGNADIFVMPFAPGNSTAEDRAENLTQDRADDFNPAFSPDGSRIAWTRPSPRLTGPRRMMTEILVMAADGSGSDIAVDGDRIIAGAPAWSRDGESLFFHGIFHEGSMESLIRRYSAGLTSRIWRAPLSGGGPVPVTEPDNFLALSPAPAPDGRVAFFRGRRPPSRGTPLYHRTGAIRLVDADGSDLGPAYDPARLSLCLAPAYDADGRLACHGPGATDGSGAVNLTPDSDANDAFPAWSPDCRTIAFRSGRDGDKEIYLMDADGGNVRRLTRREGVETAPDISPDGEWIAFVTDRDGMADEFLLTDDPQPYDDIWAVPVEGGEAVRLTDDKWEDGLPRWGTLR